jgi:hypothetical protein
MALRGAKWRLPGCSLPAEYLLAIAGTAPCPLPAAHGSGPRLLRPPGPPPNHPHHWPEQHFHALWHRGGQPAHDCCRGGQPCRQPQQVKRAGALQSCRAVSQSPAVSSLPMSVLNKQPALVFPTPHTSYSPPLLSWQAPRPAPISQLRGSAILCVPSLPRLLSFAFDIFTKLSALIYFCLASPPLHAWLAPVCRAAGMTRTLLQQRPSVFLSVAPLVKQHPHTRAAGQRIPPAGSVRATGAYWSGADACPLCVRRVP